jgi:enoyl-CoA hydratase/carnithine racemase
MIYEGIMEMGLSVSWMQDLGLVEAVYEEERLLEEIKSSFCKWLLKLSPLAYGWSKNRRNRNLLKELSEEVFPWEIRAQAECLNSDYFREKARAFLEKNS